MRLFMYGKPQAACTDTETYSPIIFCARGMAISAEMGPGGARVEVILT